MDANSFVAFWQQLDAFFFSQILPPSQYYTVGHKLICVEPPLWFKYSAGHLTHILDYIVSRRFLY